MASFNLALGMKSMQHFLFDKWLWSRVTKSKYIKEVPLNTLFRSMENDLKGTSIIWNNFIRIFHWIQKWISWDIGSCKSVEFELICLLVIGKFQVTCGNSGAFTRYWPNKS